MVESKLLRVTVTWLFELQCCPIANCLSHVVGYYFLANTSKRDVAQSGSARDWGSRGRRFKSGRPDHFESFLSS